MDLDFLVARIVFPIVITGAFFLFPYYHPKIALLMRKRLPRLTRAEIDDFLNGFTVRTEGWQKAVVISALLAIGLDAVLGVLFAQSSGGSGNTFWFFALFSGVLAPIAEEFLVRGFLLGLCLSIIQLEEKRHRLSAEALYARYAFAVLFVSLAFTASHMPASWYSFAARFVPSLLYCILFMSSNRNLLGPIAAHAAANWYFIAMTSWY